MKKLLYMKHTVWLVLFIIGLLINILTIAVASRSETIFYAPDSYDYVTLADSLVNHFSYSKGMEPELFRAPGYPFFIAPLRFCFSDTVLPIVFLQFLLLLGICILVYLISRQLFFGHPFFVRFVPGLVLISPVITVAVCKILSEILFAFFLLLTIYIINDLNTSKSSKNSSRYSLFAGITFGILCWIRAIALPLIPLFILFIYLRTKTLKSIAVFSLPVLLFVGGWSARNCIETGYCGFSTVSSIAFYRYYACTLLSKQRHIPFFEQLSKCDKELAKFETQKQKAEFAKKEAVKIISSAPLSYVMIHLKSDINILLPGVGDFFKLYGVKLGGNGTIGVIQDQGVLPAVKFYFAGKWRYFIYSIPFFILLLLKYIGVGITYLLVIIFMLNSVKNKDLKLILSNMLIVMLSIISLYFILVPGPVATPRFRVPIDPILAILGVWGWYTVLNILRNKTLSLSGNTE